MSDVEVYKPPRGNPSARREDPLPTVLRCRWCGAETAYETMSSFGARCGSCYASFCRRKAEHPKVPVSQLPKDARGADWAYRLRWRHQQGEALTAAQVSMYREAIARREGVSSEVGQ